MKVLTLPSDVERGLWILVVDGRFNGNTTGLHDFLKAVSFVDVNMVGHLHVFEHVEVLSSLNIFSGHLSELLIGNLDVHCIVNIRPLWGGSCFLAELRVSEHEVGCLFEVVEGELLFDGGVARGLPACADLLKGFLWPDALWFPEVNEECLQHFIKN